MNKAFIQPLKNSINEDSGNITHAYIDATELIYGGVEMFKKLHCTDRKVPELKDPDGCTLYRIPPRYKPSVNEDDREEFDEDEVVFGIMKSLHGYFDISIANFMNVIATFRNLKKLVIGFDGTPCYGKILNQITRRKADNTRYYYKNRLLFSTAMILPGTNLANVYIDKLKERITKLCAGEVVLYGVTILTHTGTESSVKFHLVSELVFTSNNIPGEAEHKILTILREDIRSGNLQTGTPLVWSSDADTIVSLIGDVHLNTYIYTKTYDSNGAHPAIVLLDEFKKRIILSGDVAIYKSMMIVIELLGNDYLPEMADTNNVENFIKGIGIYTSDRPPMLVTQLNGTYIINSAMLANMFHEMTKQEFARYSKKVKFTNGRVTTESRIPRIFENLCRSDVDNKIKYYSELYQFYTGNTTNSLEDLYDFEYEMATNYLEVFYWYHYYQSGYSVGGNLSNPYYKYSHPPLYNSLYMVLNDAKPETMKRFDYLYNPELVPVPITHRFYELLPSYIALHHLMVLPQLEYELEYPEAKRVNDDRVKVLRNSLPRRDIDFPMRRKGNIVTFVQRLDIDAVLATHRLLYDKLGSGIDVIKQERHNQQGLKLIPIKRFNTGS